MGGAAPPTPSFRRITPSGGFALAVRGGRSPGSRRSASRPAFPVTQWRDPARALRPQLRGQPGLCRPLPGRRTPFPFDPGYGNRRGTETKPESRAGTSGDGGGQASSDRQGPSEPPVPEPGDSGRINIEEIRNLGVSVGLNRQPMQRQEPRL